MSDMQEVLIDVPLIQEKYYETDPDITEESRECCRRNCKDTKISLQRRWYKEGTPAHHSQRGETATVLVNGEQVFMFCGDKTEENLRILIAALQQLADEVKK